MEGEAMSKTAREVIAECSLGPDSMALDHLFESLDAAGFVIVPKEEIRKALADATASDNWHKYGEGYSDLRRYLEKLIAQTSPSGDR